MYNEENGIRRTLQSIYNQTFQDFEIIVVDDGSTDKSAEIVITEFPKVRLIRQENHGIAVALNRGLQECMGQYIARIDCNDEAYPDRFKCQVEVLQQNSDYAVVGGHVMLFEKDGTDIGICKFPTSSAKAVRDLLRGNHPISHEAALIRKSILDQVEGYDPYFTGREDYELWCRISLIAKITNINRVVTRTLSTTEGITFGGMHLAPLIELALLERRERNTNGLGWKNQILREKYIKDFGICKNQNIKEKQLKRNAAILYCRRARCIFVSGDRKNARREFLRAIKKDKFYILGWIGLIIIHFIPIRLLSIIYEPYCKLKFVLYNRKFERIVHKNI